MPLQILDYPALIKRIDNWGYFLGMLYRTNQIEKCHQFIGLIDPILNMIIKLNMYYNPYEEEENSRR